MLSVDLTLGTTGWREVTMLDALTGSLVVRVVWKTTGRPAVGVRARAVFAGC